MERVIRPASRIVGALRVPGDKSISHRALILGALAPRTTLVRGLAPGLDVRSTRRCLERLGVRFEDISSEEAGVLGPEDPAAATPGAGDGEGAGEAAGTAAEADAGEARARDAVLVRGAGFAGLEAPEGSLDCGNSGTTMRLLAGVLSACDMDVTLTGDGSLLRRPMARVAEPLRRMGARIEGAEGVLASGRRGLVPPLAIRGTARPQAVRVDLAVASAQVKSAVLLAGLRAEGRTTVAEPSRSRDHTERMLRVFGVDVMEEGTAVSIEGPCDLEAAEIEVPGDISSAAFFLCAAAALPGSRLVVRGAGVNPGRTGVLEVLEAMGAPVAQGEPREQGFEPVADLALGAPERLRATRVAGAVVPRAIDELVVLAVLAARAEGTTEVRDAAELRVKESDRIAMVAANLARMGARCEALEDGIRVEGPAALRGARIETGGDHRIAMAFAVAGLLAEGETVIEDADCADVSYPGFYEDLERVAVRA
jgi:3-phosphoshikimate 1-carboxyvinyltransferase